MGADSRSLCDSLVSARDFVRFPRQERIRANSGRLDVPGGELDAAKAPSGCGYQR
jgi:hypothetical protein